MRAIIIDDLSDAGKECKACFAKRSANFSLPKSKASFALLRRTDYAYYNQINKIIQGRYPQHYRPVGGQTCPPETIFPGYGRCLERKGSKVKKIKRFQKSDAAGGREIQP
jgi:hypothetical protein